MKGAKGEEGCSVGLLGAKQISRGNGRRLKPDRETLARRRRRQQQ